MLHARWRGRSAWPSWEPRRHHVALAPLQAAFSGGNGLAAWNHTWIWGGYNGEITYFEPMVKVGWASERWVTRGAGRGWEGGRVDGGGLPGRDGASGFASRARARVQRSPTKTSSPSAARHPPGPRSVLSSSTPKTCATPSPVSGAPQAGPPSPACCLLLVACIGPRLAPSAAEKHPSQARRPPARRAPPPHPPYPFHAPSAGMPENFALGGWRPSEYCVTVVEGGVRVELRSFQWCVAAAAVTLLLCFATLWLPLLSACACPRLCRPKPPRLQPRHGRSKSPGRRRLAASAALGGRVIARPPRPAAAGTSRAAPTRTCWPRPAITWPLPAPRRCRPTVRRPPPCERCPPEPLSRFSGRLHSGRLCHAPQEPRRLLGSPATNCMNGVSGRTREPPRQLAVRLPWRLRRFTQRTPRQHRPPALASGVFCRHLCCLPRVSSFETKDCSSLPVFLINQDPLIKEIRSRAGRAVELPLPARQPVPSPPVHPAQPSAPPSPPPCAFSAIPSIHSGC
jgi:hypothetical protein